MVLLSVSKISITCFSLFSIFSLYLFSSVYCLCKDSYSATASSETKKHNNMSTLTSLQCNK